jgi:hypothetical protein
MSEDLKKKFTVEKRDVVRQNRRVKLIGKSRQGSVRLNESGDTWIVLNEASQLPSPRHRSCVGPFALVENNGKTMWVSTTDDPDYDVIEVEKK